MAAGSLDNMFCSRCDEGFEPHEKIVNSNGELWHTQCFVYVINLLVLLNQRQITNCSMLFSQQMRAMFSPISGWRFLRIRRTQIL